MRICTVAWMGLSVALCLGRPAIGQASVASEDAAGVMPRSARVSYLEGEVTVGRAAERESVAAQPNMALGQGSTIRTGERGQAELEFEDGSVARLTPHSTLVLNELRTDADDQGTMTVMQVDQGLVYLELRAAGVARFRVFSPVGSFWPLENVTVRVNVDTPPGIIAVLDGRIHVEHEGAGVREVDGPLVQMGFKTEVRGGESLKSDPSDDSRYFLSEGIGQESWDEWNEARDQAAADALERGTEVRREFAGTKGYGWSDLDANGTWYGDSGQPPVWQPDEALQFGFDPYGYGSWTYLPGAGYTWASGYSWGWTPYRCGHWQYWDGFGWGWQPDGYCGSRWRLGRGVNVFRGPLGYVQVGVPIKPRPGVHPILPGPHPGERPPFGGPARHNDKEHRIAGVVVRPIRPAGFGFTSHGGSALGSALRRDYPVDSTTRTPVAGIVSSAFGGRQTAGETNGAGLAWHSVSARPDGPGERMDGLRGGFMRGATPVQAGPGEQSRTPVRHGPDAAATSRTLRPGENKIERSEPSTRQTPRQSGGPTQQSGVSAARPEPQRAMSPPSAQAPHPTQAAPPPSPRTAGGSPK